MKNIDRQKIRFDIVGINRKPEYKAWLLAENLNYKEAMNKIKYYESKYEVVGAEFTPHGKEIVNLINRTA